MSRLFNIFLLFSVLFLSCEKEDDKEEQATPEVQQKEYVYQTEKIEILELGNLWNNKVSIRIENEQEKLLVHEAFWNVYVPTEKGLISSTDNSVWEIRVYNNDLSSISFYTNKHPKHNMVNDFEFRIPIQSYHSHAPFSAIIKGVRREI